MRPRPSRRRPVSSRRRGRVGRAVVGAQQRQVNPLPEGRYWYDTFGAAGRQTFLEWRGKYKDSVRVLTTEESAGPPAHSWFLFAVDHPVPFDPKGFPSIASADVRSAGDTITRPDPIRDPTDAAYEWLRDADPFAKLETAALWIGGGILLYLLLTSGKDPAPLPLKD